MLHSMVGRCGPDGLPGGAVAVLKVAAKAGGWFTWTTEGTVTKPVKTVAAKDSPDGKAIFEDRPFARVHIKGRSRDGRRFVLRYILNGDKWTVDATYILTHEHEATTDDGETIRWTTEKPSFDAASVAEVKAYVKRFALLKVPTAPTRYPQT
jgi:hypothetical protein